ncbi:hypothetical protein GOODEAATRI_000063 [Goodea atripinnis]|uniref:Uncharacterized protein n=1 Tax=Goodea atripinnis TaxID=208336 RepID=A0ABV0PJG1_9TELE
MCYYGSNHLQESGLVKMVQYTSAVGQETDQRRMGADYDSSHTPSSKLSRRLRSLLIVPEKLQQHKQPFSTLVRPLLSLLNNVRAHHVDDVTLQISPSLKRNITAPVCNCTIH